jgi:hypothetical protein
MSDRRRAVARVLLAYSALGCALPGLWATLAPRSFFRDFPGGPWHFVAPLPPFNAHLVADVGAFYVAFAIVFAWAAARPDRRLVVPLALGWTAFAALHLGWHAAHLTPFSPGAAIAQLASLASVLVAPALAAWLVCAGRARSAGR